MTNTLFQKVASRIARKTRDAYSFPDYGITSWRASCLMLLRRGYSALESEAIMRSKWTRWAADGATGRKPTSADLKRWLDNPANHITKASVGNYCMTKPERVAFWLDEDTAFDAGSSSRFCRDNEISEADWAAGVALSEQRREGRVRLPAGFGEGLPEPDPNFIPIDPSVTLPPLAELEEAERKRRQERVAAACPAQETEPTNRHWLGPESSRTAALTDEIPGQDGHSDSDGLERSQGTRARASTATGAKASPGPGAQIQKRSGAVWQA